MSNRRWIEVQDPDSELQHAGIGAIVDIECEIYVPDMIKSLSSKGGAGEFLETLEVLLPAAEMAGLDMEGLPEQEEQAAAYKNLMSAFGGDQVLVGDRDDSSWRIAGTLLGAHLRGEIEGYARVVGKVSSKWSAGHWKPLLSLPGTNLLPREQRRALEKKGPEPGSEDNWLEGPGLMLRSPRRLPLNFSEEEGSSTTSTSHPAESLYLRLPEMRPTVGRDCYFQIQEP